MVDLTDALPVQRRPERGIPYAEPPAFETQLNEAYG